MMVHITNGRITLTVPKSAYHEIYESQGFSMIPESPHCEETLVVNTHTEDEKQHLEDLCQEEAEDTDANEGETEDASDEEGSSEDDEGETRAKDYSETPLSELGFDALCDYADQLGIDHTGVRSKKELRALIKEHRKG